MGAQGAPPQAGAARQVCPHTAGRACPRGAAHGGSAPRDLPAHARVPRPCPMGTGGSWDANPRAPLGSGPPAPHGGAGAGPRPLPLCGLRPRGAAVARTGRDGGAGPGGGGSSGRFVGAAGPGGPGKGFRAGGPGYRGGAGAGPVRGRCAGSRLPRRCGRTPPVGAELGGSGAGGTPRDGVPDVPPGPGTTSSPSKTPCVPRAASPTGTLGTHPGEGQGGDIPLGAPPSPRWV